MRTLFAAILVAFTVSASSTSFASAASVAPAPESFDNGQRKQTDAVTFAIDNSKVDVIVHPTESAKIIIRIKDSFGHSIATKTLSEVESGTRVRFDLSQLEDGLYHLSVWDGKNNQKQDIELKTVPPAAPTQEVSFI